MWYLSCICQSCVNRLRAYSMFWKSIFVTIVALLPISVTIIHFSFVTNLFLLCDIFFSKYAVTVYIAAFVSVVSLVVYFQFINEWATTLLSTARSWELHFPISLEAAVSFCMFGILCFFCSIASRTMHYQVMLMIFETNILSGILILFFYCYVKETRRPGVVCFGD